MHDWNTNAAMPGLVFMETHATFDPSTPREDQLWKEFGSSSMVQNCIATTESSEKKIKAKKDLLEPSISLLNVY